MRRWPSSREHRCPMAFGCSRRRCRRRSRSRASSCSRRARATRRADIAGIAHFAEHMFFKGTERRPTARDISAEIDGIGGEFNAFTGKEYTGYYVKCAAGHARRGARRARRHDPQLALRRRGDRPREGRHRRGDEHVLRHAPRLRRRRLRRACSTATTRSAATSSAPRRPCAPPPARRSRRSSTAGTGPSGSSSGSAAGSATA